MNELPIVHMTLYKHGVGFYRRRGPVEGEAINLTFRREEMDDLLKSLTVIDYGAGQVRGIDYDTPQSQAERLAGNSVILDDRASLRDLLIALRGRQVTLTLSDGGSESGLLVGLDEDAEAPLKDSRVTLIRQETDLVLNLSISQIEGIELRDQTAADDLRFFLKTALGQETHRSITIRLTPEAHDLEVSYIAPAPTWRVSYRLVVDEVEKADGSPAKALLQGWGIFDNRLEEDLTDISLSLTAGMPISFVYDLYTPKIPERPLVQDEERVAAGPVMFEEALEEDAFAAMAAAPAPAAAAPQSLAQKRGVGRAMRAEDVAQSVESAAEGQAMGELFQYNVTTPVTVGRGQSAMVPIVSTTLGIKKDLIYNGAKMPAHPVATLRFDNRSGLTLERGPVTVLESGAYVGEAVLPFTADKAEAVISYAVELGVHVKESLKSETQFHALEIKDHFLVQHVYNIRRKTYAVDNRTGESKQILIEHPLNPRYTIFETPDPAEKTADTHRYGITIEPRRMVEFVVNERVLEARREQLKNLSYQGLQKYFADKLLDKATYAGLKSLLEVWAEIDRLQKTIAEQEQLRAKIYEMQEKAQKNMGVLSNSGEEGRLRGRYVKQLADSEERLAEIAQTIARTEAAIKEKQATVVKMISDLGR